MKKKPLFVTIVLILLLAGCGQLEAPPTPAPTDIPTVAAANTSTSAPTETISPAPTDIPAAAPANTSVPEPAATIPPTPTSGITPTPSPVPPFSGVVEVWEVANAVYGGGWPANAALTIVVASPDGVQKETLSVNTTENGELPWTELSDGDLEESDLITIHFRDSQAQFPILMVAAVADPALNTIAGVAEPFVQVTATVEHPAGTYTTIETIADAAGNFSIDFSPKVDWDETDFFAIGQVIHANGIIQITNESPQVQVVLPPEEIAGYLVSTFSSPDNFVPSDTGTLLIDFDSDGDLDLFVSQTYWPPQPSPVLAFRNDGAGNFTEATAEVFGGMADEAENPRHWAVADFNGDGRDDLFLADHGLDWSALAGGGDSPGGQSRIFMQSEAGQLIDETTTRLPQIIAFTHNVSAGDIDGDGDVDIYMGNWIGHTPEGPQFYINNGEGFFALDKTRLPAVVANDGYSAGLLVDVDKDDDLDLVLGYPGGQVYAHDTLLLNDGSGQFSLAPDASLPLRLNGGDVEEVGISSADFDNDGWPDLIIALQLVSGARWYDPTLQLLLNNGDGTFRDESGRIDQDWSAYHRPDRVGEDSQVDWSLIVDFNDDGWPDIVAVGYNVMNLLFQNIGGETISVVENVSEYARHLRDFKAGRLDYPEFVIPGDLDGDGDLDFILLFTNSNNQVVLLRK